MKKTKLTGLEQELEKTKNEKEHRKMKAEQSDFEIKVVGYGCIAFILIIVMLAFQ